MKTRIRVKNECNLNLTPEWEPLLINPKYIVSAQRHITLITVIMSNGKEYRLENTKVNWVELEENIEFIEGSR